MNRQASHGGEASEQRGTRERRNQKLRTRAALLDGARAVLARGEALSVTAAAREAGISKATAYRYFSDARVLSASAGLPMTVPPYEEIVDGIDRPRDRVIAVSDYLIGVALDYEAAMRQHVARSLDAWLVSGGKQGARRAAARVALLEAAIEDLSIDPDQAERLLHALAATTVTETLIALRDVMGADDARVRATVRDITCALLDRFAPE